MNDTMSMGAAEIIQNSLDAMADDEGGQDPAGARIAADLADVLERHGLDMVLRALSSAALNADPSGASRETVRKVEGFAEDVLNAAKAVRQ